MSKTKWFFVLLLILVAASFFRLYKIDSIPPGLYPDVAMNGNNAIEALETGEYKVFYPENNGREGLMMNLQAVSIGLFGKTVWPLYLVSAIAGILTVLGLYLLTKEILNQEIALISAYLLAISFWHVNFSRMGFRAILAPLILTWAFYFLWKGLRSSKLAPFGLSGFFWGLGFYTYISFRTAPLILGFILWAYWQSIKKDFSHEKYIDLRNQIVRGLALLMVIAILVFLPLGYYFLANPQDFLGRTGQLSVFAGEKPFTDLLVNFGKTLGMFNFSGDWNWRHNYAGSPMLSLPVGILFALGFIKTWVNLFKHKKEHGHLSTVPVLLLSWFFIMALPAALSNEGVPHALRAIIMIPPVFIMAGKGAWWLFEYMTTWYDPVNKRMHNVSKYAAVTLAIFLAALGFGEFKKYFIDWAENPNVADAVSNDYVRLGEKLNSMPKETKKYVLVNANGVLVNGIPMPSQTVMYITDTYTAEKQKEKNLFYLTEDQYRAGRYDKKAMIFHLNN